MTFTLTKHQALGNDFLVTFDRIGDGASLARTLCDRRRGIGADGLLLASRLDDRDDDWTMVLFNADGSRAEMSGNGIRCFAQAVARRLGMTQGSLRVHTDAGLRTLDITPGAHAAEIWATVEMGAAAPLDPPVNWGALGCDPGRPVAHLSMGNPHSVVLTDDVRAVDLEALGRLVPDVNLEIVEPGPEPGAITMRVHERGAGITEACGTGASAAAHAAVSWGIVAGTTVTVHQPGGDAEVLVGETLVLRGPSAYVATIMIDGDISA
ncbi:MAG: diaminopimelate epimerase [Acidimicrobiia bacterium]